MNQYLPATIRLPFGYTVTIKAVSPRTLRRVAGTQVYGYSNGETRTIYIDKTVNEQRQRYILAHEMQHIFTDWTHLALGEHLSHGPCRWCGGTGARNG